jgi:hypothetical protein
MRNTGDFAVAFGTRGDDMKQVIELLGKDIK